MDCIKSGNLCLPFLVDPKVGSPIIDRMQIKIDSIVNEIRDAIYQRDLKFLESSASEGDNILD